MQASQRTATGAAVRAAATQLVGVSEACERFRVTPSQLYRDAINGKVHPLVVHGRASAVYAVFELAALYTPRGKGPYLRRFASLVLARGGRITAPARAN